MPRTAWEHCQELGDEQLAARSGVTLRAIRSMEQKSSRPRWDLVARLVRALGPDVVTLGLVDGPAGG
jgi:hypothetical protein